MSYYVKKAFLKGDYSGVPSKSISHRVLLLATLVDEFEINNCLIAKDTLETIKAIEALGFSVKINENKLIINKVKKVEMATISLSESASTLRFIIPFSLLHVNRLEIALSDNLKRRFNDIYQEIFKNEKIEYIIKANKVSISGSLRGYKYFIPKTISSQFISGLLMTLPFVKGDSQIVLDETPSKPYLDITIDLLEKMGIKIEKNEEGYFIKGSQKITKNNYEVENDYSNAAFFLVANHLGADIKMKSLNKDSKQGDKEIYNLIRQKEINLYHYPDLAPILFVYAALQDYSIKFRGLENLVYKESNRLDKMLFNLSLVGAKFSLEGDELTFYPAKLVGGVKVSDYNDHRIAMSMIILGSVLAEGLVINSISSIDKSYPTFIDDFKLLGGIIDVS